METVLSIKPFLAVLVSLAAIPFIVGSRTHNMRESWTFIAAIIKFLLVLSMLPMVLKGKTIVYTVVQIFPDLGIAFRVDAFGMLFALVASSLWIVTSIYSLGYMRGLDEHSQTRYFSFFAVALSATIGVAFSANLLTLYLFYEMLSLATYPLVTHHQDRSARSSGRKYLFYILGGSIGLALPAMLITYHFTGTLDFAAHGIMAGHVNSGLALVLSLMFLFGFAKVGIMPMHSWLPAAMVAPTPVSALLHAVAVVKVGAFSVVRVFTGIVGTDVLAGFHINGIICVIASITVVVASLIALSQDELKRRLAFSTIGQLSYIVLGVGLLSASGMTGGMLHIAMHAFGKITLFFCAGAIFCATGIKNISQMKGIGRQMPITMTAFLIGSLSVVGLPPCGGFISKWYLVVGTIESGQMLLLLVLLLSSFLNAAYFFPVFYNAFFLSEPEMTFENRVSEAPIWCVVPLTITAGISMVLFFYPQPFLNLAKLAVQSINGG
ncbi:MAG: monovalent cation/H+ antiporter subunit D family protein [Desulfobacteraceae bacterium]|nr:monovalent cation/H+ antiporter subunit D family protein [Desulfobacteraceae bacterium]